MAIAFLRHTFIGKSKQAQPYTAAAHARYIMRKGETVRVYSEGMPRQYHAVQRWLTQHEDTIRKNGRVIDKLILALPREMTPEQGVELVRRFGRAVSACRAPFLFTLQGWDAHNPHAHFMLIDKDTDTGRRVFQTTEKGSTVRLMALWQDTTNQMLEELGIDARIQFGPKQEEEVTLPADAVVEPLPPEEEVFSVQSPRELNTEQPLQEPDPPDYVEPEPEEDGLIVREEGQTTLTSARDLLEMSRERTILLTAIERRNAAWDAFRGAEDALQNALGAVAHKTMQQTMAENALRSAQWQLEQTHQNGKPKGLRLSLFGFEWKGPRYKLAEAAQTVHEERLAAYERAQTALYSARQVMESAQGEWQRLQETALALNDQLKVYGTEDEALDALDTFQATIKYHAENIDFDELRNEFSDGKITREEYLEVCNLMGEQMEEEREEGEGEGQSY
jgi:hypothetical protein